MGESAPSSQPGREQEFLQTLRDGLDDVEAALGKLESGNYGLCEVCSEPIPEETLERLPAERFCALHQRSTADGG